MSKKTRQRAFHFKNIIPPDPEAVPFADWPVPNRNFYKAFRRWLQKGGYSENTVHLYSVAARTALGYLPGLYWQIDPEKDLEKVSKRIVERGLSESTQVEYNKGLLKLAEYLRHKLNKPDPPRPINWSYHLSGVPDWLSDLVKEYLNHRRKEWRPEDKHRRTLDVLGRLAPVLRFMAETAQINSLEDLDPILWFDYLEMRLAAGINPTTINCHLYGFKRFLYYLDESDKPVCQRTLLIKPLTAGGRVPKDIPIEQLKSLLAEIEDQAIHKHASNRRMAILDRAWVHLMLYSGLRTCEVRQMRLKDINWESQRIRIEASKGFNDRMVFMNMITVDTLKKWMEIRGDAEYLTDHVFLYRHKPLSRRYCQVRLSTYGKRTGNHISPHKLRHSCATLLLNAGAPIVTVQTLLGHKKIDTTLGYARLYDGTVAADYYRAMGQVEKLFDVCPVDQDLAPNPAELLVLVDSLSTGTLNESQRNTLALLRARIQSLETDLDYTFALENQFVPIGIHEESE
jgi:site-specific recombinase XerD